MRFPGSSARALWNTIQRILTLPDETRLFTGHDYMPGQFGMLSRLRGRQMKNDADVGLRSLPAVRVVFFAPHPTGEVHRLHQARIDPASRRPPGARQGEHAGSISSIWRPFNADRMTMWRVSTRVNSPTNDVQQGEDVMIAGSLAQSGGPGGAKPSTACPRFGIVF